MNGILVKIISKQVADRPKDWDKHLITALWAYRTSFKASTQFTPFHLVYGQEALLPIEVEVPSHKLLLRTGQEPHEQWDNRLMNLHKLEATREMAMDYYIFQASKKRDKFNEQLKAKDLGNGMLVLRYDSRLDNRYDAKFLPRWEGPFLIDHRYKNGSYQLKDLSGKLHQSRVNGWRLKPFFQRFDATSTPTPLSQEETQSKVEDSRTKIRHFLVLGDSHTLSPRTFPNYNDALEA